MRFEKGCSPTLAQHKTKLGLNIHVLAVRSMIEVDMREFRGDRGLFAKFLQEKLKIPVHVQHHIIGIGDGDESDLNLKLDTVKDAAKKALHHMGADEYHVTTQSGTVTIRQRKARERHEARRGSVPSAKQTVPYFFPG